MKNLYRIACIGASALLCGCAAEIRYPDKVVFAPTNQMNTLRASGEKLHKSYSDNIDHLSNTTNASALYNIGTGVVLAASAIYGAPKDVISAVGLGAGTNAVSNTTFNPQGQIAIYEAGYSALGCMLNASTKIPEAEVARVWAENATYVKSVRPQLVAPGGERQQDALLKARQEIRFELSAAAAITTIERVGAIVGKAVAAVDGAPRTFSSNLNSLDRAVRRKLRETLSARDSIAIRDDILKQIRDGQAEAEEARKLRTEMAIVAAEFRGMSTEFLEQKRLIQTTNNLESAARALEFDATLKACQVSAGL